MEKKYSEDNARQSFTNHFVSSICKESHEPLVCAHGIVVRELIGRGGRPACVGSWAIISDVCH